MTRAIRSRAARCNTATGRHLPVFPLRDPRNPAAASTLDSIQCHSISQCNAHAAAYRRVSPVKRLLFPAGASRVKCTACNRSVHQGKRERAHADSDMASVSRFYTQISFFQLHFVAYSWPRPRGADLENCCPRAIQRANVASTIVTIDLRARFFNFDIFQKLQVVGAMNSDCGTKRINSISLKNHKR